MHFLVAFALHVTTSVLTAGTPSQLVIGTATTAESVVDTAIARMGGLSVLRGIKRAKYDIAIQWLNPTFDARPYTNAPGRECPSGGAAWVARTRLPIYAAQSAVEELKVSLGNYGPPLGAIHPIAAGRWIRATANSRDSLWAEPIDFPNAPRALLLYVPSMKWVYSSGFSGTLEKAIVKRRISERGWSVDFIGTVQNPLGDR